MSSMANSAGLRFHKALYGRQAIDAAIATFSDFATFEVRVEDQHFAVDINNVQSDVEGDVVAEFGNFVLANTLGLRDGVVADSAS